MAETVTLYNENYVDSQEIVNALDSVNLGSYVYSNEVNGVCVIVYEKLFLRVMSSATLTVVIDNSDGTTNVSLIGAGGGEGLFNLSWGSNRSYVKKCVNALSKIGFR